MRPRKVVAFHEGRGSQEGIFAEHKTHCQMDYVPVKTRAGSQLYMFAGIFAHNLTRELQIQLDPRARGTTAKRAALWYFREIGTLRPVRPAYYPRGKISGKPCPFWLG